MRFSTRLVVFYTILLKGVCAHMELKYPYPIRSPFDPLTPPNDIDYNLKSPLNADGSNYPCRGYQNDRPIRTTATYLPGQQYNMTVTGSATHGGGSCQISLSYDNGETFKVIKSIIGACPLTPTYDFIVPSFAPAGDVLFAWTWFNEIGNREMYMSCAWANIAVPAKSRRSSRLDRLQERAQYASIDSLPDIWRANIQGLSNCSTVEGQDVAFADPGPQVEYGGSMSASSPITLPNGNCDSSNPAGQLFKQLAVDGAAPSAISAPAVALSAALPSSSTSGTASQSVIAGVFAQGASVLSSSTTAISLATTSSAQTAASASTTSIIAITVLRNATTTPIAVFPVLNSTATSNVTNSTNGLVSVPLSNDTSISLNSTVPIQVANTTFSVASPSTSNFSSSTNEPSVINNTITSQLNSPIASTLAFAGDQATAYLPCVPGAFLCVSSTSFLICDQAPGVVSMTPLTEFKGPIPVAAGMECLPFLQTFPDQESATRFADGQNVKNGFVPAGSFRSDRYVLAGTVAR